MSHTHDHDETMGEMFDRGLALRREVLGADYVDGSIKNANDFMMAFQHITTEWAWGYAWGRPTLDKKTRSMLNLAMLTALGKSPEIKLHVRGASPGADRLQRRGRKPYVLLPFGWRASRRVHLGRPAARDHAHVRMRSDDCNRVQLFAIERQNTILVLEQDDALLGDAARRFEAALHIHHALLYRVIDNTTGKLRAQHAAHMVIQLSH